MDGGVIGALVLDLFWFWFWICFGFVFGFGFYFGFHFGFYFGFYFGFICVCVVMFLATSMYSRTYPLREPSASANQRNYEIRHTNTCAHTHILIYTYTHI